MGSGNFKHPDEDIELTPEETHAALLKAKIEKGARIRAEEYAKKINQPKTYAKLTSKELYDLACKELSAMVPGYVFDSKNEQIFFALCMYFAGDDRAETEYGLSLQKGIMLHGPVGCGKTTMLRAFAKNSFNPFSEVSCRTVASDYSLKETGGSLAIDHYSTFKEVYPGDFYGHKQIGYFFDDLGTENVKKHFGNELNVMEEILLNRYDDRALKAKTHITTNLSGDEIGNIYGSRVRSRLREMVNVIIFDKDAPDRRS